MRNTDPTKNNRGWTQMLATGNQFLLHIRHPTRVTHIELNPVKQKNVCKIHITTHNIVLSIKLNQDTSYETFTSTVQQPSLPLYYNILVIGTLLSILVAWGARLTKLYSLDDICRLQIYSMHATICKDDVHWCKESLKIPKGNHNP